MGIFDLLFQKKNQNIERWKMPADEIDRAQRVEASPKFRNKIYRRYYSDYPEKPFISQDRELYTNWSEVPLGSIKLVSKEMMTRYKDGLLPGHVYMLYWIEKFNRSRIPSYFEYEYGIEFEKEKIFLIENGYLDQHEKLTARGKSAIEQHHNVIDARHPAPKHSAVLSPPLPKQPHSGRMIPARMTAMKEPIPSADMSVLQAEISYINHILQLACQLSEISSSFSINHDKLKYGLKMYETHYEWMPHTKSGKPAKYPLMLRYAYDDIYNPTPPNECFGEVYYLTDGTIGKARLIFWSNKTGHVFYFGQTNGNLVVKKVVQSNPPQKIVLYKEQSR